jgi:hypothetical protein
MIEWFERANAAMSDVYIDGSDHPFIAHRSRAQP